MRRRRRQLRPAADEARRAVVATPRAGGSDFTRDAAVYLVARSVPALLQLATIAVFARLLGPTNYAIYTLAAAGAFSIAELVSQWAQQAITRFYPETVAREGEAQFRATLLAALIVALCATLALGVVVTIVGVALGLGLAVVELGVALIVTTSLFNVLRAYFQASLRPARWALYSILNAVGRLALALALIPVLGSTASAFLLGAVLTYVLVLGPMMREVVGGASIRRAHGLGDALRRWWSYGWPLSGWSTSLQILALGDRYLLAWLRGAYQAGVYSSIYDLANRGLYPVVDAVVLTVQPLVMHAADEPDRIRALIARSCRHIMIFILPVLALTIVDGHRVVHLVLGDAYVKESRILPFLIGGFLAWHVGSAVQKTLEVTNRTRIVLLAAGSAALANIALNIPLILWQGILGAAIATLASYVVYLAVVSVAGGRALAWRFPLGAGLRITAAAAVFGLVVGLVGAGWDDRGWGSLLVALALGILAYAGALLALGKPPFAPRRSAASPTHAG
jgi:O-antigen/teichoic acid export membrane protein